MSSSFNTPFRDLKKSIKLPEKQAPVAKPHNAPQPQPKEEINEEDLFWQEMQGVTPIKQDGRVRVAAPPPAAVRRRAEAEENEALAELYDLVAGRADFDVTDTEEYIEGCVIGLDTALVRKLRQGDFSRQAALDLHGMKTEEAQIEVEKFLSTAVQKGLRCVLIVHGRGRNSPGQVPVLKDRLRVWLTRGKLARSVLAFSSSRPYDGGPGALYVLLRRDRARKKSIAVLEGAKRE